MNKIGRRDFLAQAAIAGAVTKFGFGERKRRPNVLIIQPDQHRGTIMRCAGDKQAITPNLDRLAAGGIRFQNAVSASPVCSPFRGTFQTGLYPHKHGIVKNNLRMDPGLTCFAERFVEAGYRTGYIGKWHLDGGNPEKEGGVDVTPNAVGGYVPAERRQGWQEWGGYEKSHEYFEVWKYNSAAQKERVKGYSWEPTWHTDTAVDFIKRAKQKEEPWLYYIAFGPPHKPEQCLDRYLEMYDPAKIELPPDLAGKFPPDEEKKLREIYQMYYALVTAIDFEVGRLLDELQAMGELENTIILYTSDHGDLLGSHATGGPGSWRGKASPYATAFRIPLIVHWPAAVKAGQVCEALASSVDLTPTVLELAGLPPIEGMQGDSLAGWCTLGKGPRNEAVWIGLSDWRAAWDGRYLYARGNGFNHLYDHQSDPCEMKNLLDSPEAVDQKKRMHELLLKLAGRAEDPQLENLKKLSV